MPDIEIITQETHVSIESGYTVEVEGDVTMVNVDFDNTVVNMDFGRQPIIIEQDAAVNMTVEEIHVAVSSDIAGSSGGTPGTAFLPVADEYDENDTHFYFGWDDGWLVQRQDRTTSLTVRATAANNPGYADLNAAWSARLSLVYS